MPHDLSSENIIGIFLWVSSKRGLSTSLAKFIFFLRGSIVDTHLQDQMLLGLLCFRNRHKMILESPKKKAATILTDLGVI